MTNQHAIPIRRAAGCVVYTYDTGGAVQVLLIRDRQGRWTLPKGHVEPGEVEGETAVREVFEETGITGTLGAFITRIEYPVRKRGVLFTKQVAFFLMHAATRTIVPQTDEGIDEAAWFSASAARAQAGYPSVRAVLRQALRLIRPKAV